MIFLRAFFLSLIFFWSGPTLSEVDCQKNLHTVLSGYKHLNENLSEYAELSNYLKNKKGEASEELRYQLEQLYYEQQKISYINTKESDQIQLINDLVIELKEQKKLRERFAGFSTLQVFGYRRALEYAHVLNRSEFSSIFRFTKDHHISQLLRDTYGNVTDELGKKTRHYVAPGMLASYISPTRFGKELSLMATPELNITNSHFIENLDIALVKMKNIQGKKYKQLYRGTLWPEAWLNNLINAKVHKDFGYTSVSRQIESAKKFISNPTTVKHHSDNEKGILFIYDTNKAVDITPLSNFPEETEELIPRGVNFQAHFVGYKSVLCDGIIEVKPLDNIAYVYLADTLPVFDAAKMLELRSILCK